MYVISYYIVNIDKEILNLQYRFFLSAILYHTLQCFPITKASTNNTIHMMIKTAYRYRFTFSADDRYSGIKGCAEWMHASIQPAIHTYILSRTKPTPTKPVQKFCQNIQDNHNSWFLCVSAFLLVPAPKKRKRWF